jgi:hypothetical protein
MVSSEDKNIGAGAVIIVIVIIFVIAGAMGGSDSSSDDHDIQQSTAKDVCHDAVKAQLRSPATADFGGEEVTQEGSHINVTGYVDSENGFGALLRSDFDCDTKVDGEYVRLDGAPLVTESG